MRAQGRAGGLGHAGGSAQSPFSTPAWGTGRIGSLHRPNRPPWVYRGPGAWARKSFRTLLGRLQFMREFDAFSMQAPSHGCAKCSTKYFRMKGRGVPEAESSRSSSRAWGGPLCKNDAFCLFLCVVRTDLEPARVVRAENCGASSALPRLSQKLLEDAEPSEPHHGDIVSPHGSVEHQEHQQPTLVGCGLQRS